MPVASSFGGSGSGRGSSGAITWHKLQSKWGGSGACSSLAWVAKAQGEASKSAVAAEQSR